MDDDDRLRAMFDQAAGEGPDTEVALGALGPRFTAARRRRQAGQAALVLAGVLGVAGIGSAALRPEPERSVVAVSPTTAAPDTSTTPPPSTTSTTAPSPSTTTTVTSGATTASSVPAPVTATTVPGSPVTGGTGTSVTTPQPTTGSTAPSVPSTPSTPSTPMTTDDDDDDDDDGGSSTSSSSTPATLPAPADRTVSCLGGTIVVRWTGSTLQLVQRTPAAGFTVESQRVETTRVEVRFVSGDDDSTAKVDVEDDGIETECSD